MKNKKNQINEKLIKIAFLVPNMKSNGPVVFTKYLIEGLNSRGLYIDVFYFKGEEDYDIGVNCKKINLIKNNSLKNYDIIHSTMGIPDCYASIFAPRNKWIVGIHTFIYEDVRMERSGWRSFIISNIWKLALKRNKNCIVSSDAMMKYYIKHIGQKNYSIIPYGIPQRKFGPCNELFSQKISELKKRGYKILCSVGSLIKRKGFLQILELLSKVDDTVLFIIGEGVEKEKIISYARKLGIESRVFLMGFKKDSYNYYQFADIYMHVSYSEGYGLAFLEALSFGLPVVCSRLDIYENLVSNDSVSYFEPGNIESLVNAYRRVEANIGYYKAKSIELYNNCFSFEKMINSHIDYYRKILDK